MSFLPRVVWKLALLGSRSQPVLGRLREFSTRKRPRLLVKENINLEFFKTDYELYKIRSHVPVHIGPNLCLL